jgi:hypothetical protein
VDVTELRYRKLAAEFIMLAQRTTSIGLADTFIALAGHYGSLAKIHAKYKNVAHASSSVPAGERDGSDNAT